MRISALSEANTWQDPGNKPKSLTGKRLNNLAVHHAYQAYQAAYAAYQVRFL